MSKKKQKEEQANNTLIEASRVGDLELVQSLLKEGLNIHAQDDYALRLASYNGHLEMVKYLVEQGANIHLCFKIFII